MKRNSPVIFMTILVALLLAACGSGGGSGAPQAVEAYLQAMIGKDAATLASLSCAEWEPSAQMELDSFFAVEVALDGLACEQTGTDGETALVTCQGKIIATYNNENQELPLDVRTYKVVQQGGEWLICGFQ